MGGSGSWSDFAVTKTLDFDMENILFVGNGQKTCTVVGTKAILKG
jgi:hypothetical protein